MCSLTTDFWSSCNSQSYITVTCHFIDELRSYCLNTYQVKLAHTAENIASELKVIAQQWNITDKISCVVSDNAANIVAAIWLTGWKALPCFAHMLNLVVQESVVKDFELAELQQKCRRVVTYFKQSLNANNKLGEIQKQVGGEEKLIQDVVTRWNSTFYMFERLVQEYQSVNTTVCLMDRTDLCISPSEIAILKDAITLLKPFEEAYKRAIS